MVLGMLLVGTSTTSKMFAVQKKFVLESINAGHQVTAGYSSHADDDQTYSPAQTHWVLGTPDMFFLRHCAYILNSCLPEGSQVSCLVVE